MKFYCIVPRPSTLDNTSCVKFLKAACADRAIEFVPIISTTTEIVSNKAIDLGGGELVYRLGTTHADRMAEALLVKESTATLYQDNRQLFARSLPWGNAIRLERAGLPVISLIYDITTARDKDLQRYVKQLGGFPIILKDAGGSHGAGVMRLDSIESLRSVLGYAQRMPGAHFVLRKYIHDAVHIRCVVVGNKVVDAIRYLPQPNDFRTNATSTPEVEKIEDSQGIFSLAVKATHCIGLEFGGVDILLDRDKTPYIAEVNFPCNFARNQMTTGTDIAGAMIEHLLRKVRK